MNNKLTTPKAILIGSFMIAGTILYTSGNISNPIIGTAHAEISSIKISSINLMGILLQLKLANIWLQKIYEK